MFAESLLLDFIVPQMFDELTMLSAKLNTKILNCFVQVLQKVR